MNAYYFWRDKTAILGAIKAKLPFSGGKYQDASCKFMDQTSICSLQFSIIESFSYCIGTDQIVLALRHIPLGGEGIFVNRDTEKLFCESWLKCFA